MAHECQQKERSAQWIIKKKNTTLLCKDSLLFPVVCVSLCIRLDHQLSAQELLLCCCTAQTESHQKTILQGGWLHQEYQKKTHKTHTTSTVLHQPHNKSLFFTLSHVPNIWKYFLMPPTKSASIQHLYTFNKGLLKFAGDSWSISCQSEAELQDGLCLLHWRNHSDIVKLTSPASLQEPQNNFKSFIHTPNKYSCGKKGFT